MFRTQFNRIQVNSNVGDRIRVIKSGVLNNKKQVVVKEKGTEDLYSYINSFADSVDIHVLLARFANGDKEALIKRAGAYMDISNMPTNINEFIELYHNGQAYFNSLPIEIKEKFNNNMNEFIGSIGTDKFNDIMSVSPADIKEEKINNIVESAAINKEAAKVQFNNSVYGDIKEEKVEPIIERSTK